MHQSSGILNRRSAISIELRGGNRRATKVPTPKTITMNNEESAHAKAIDSKSPMVTAFLIYLSALAIGITVFLATPDRSVSFHYERAANRWMNSESVYADSVESGHGFIYLPQAAILHIPFALATQWSGIDRLGDVLWRILSWFVLAISCWRFGLLLKSPSSTGDQQAIPLNAIQWRMALVVSLVGLSSLRIGQSTMMLTAILLLSVDAWRLKRFTLSSTLLALAIAVKPLAIVLALLIFAVSAPMRARLLASCILLIASPFAFQYPEFVVQQYRDCFAMLNTAAGLGNESHWAQVFGMMYVFGMSIPGKVQMALRLIAALGTLGLVALAVGKLKRDRQAIWMFVWMAIYLMLFNPRTENSTYCMLGPVYGFFIAENNCIRKRIWQSVVQFGLVIGTLGSYEIGKFFTPNGADSIWLAPLCCCILTGFLAFDFYRELFRSESQPLVVDEVTSPSHS